MNILFLSTEIPFPLDSGHHIRTFHTLRMLSKWHDIFFFGFFKEKDNLESIHHIQSFCKKIEVFPVRSSLRNPIFLSELFLNFFSKNPFMAQRYFNHKVRRRIEEIIAEHNIELVHFDLLHLGQYHRVVEALSKVLVNHNVESLRLSRLKNMEKNLLKKAYLHLQVLKLQRFEKKTCPLFDKCVVVSQEDKKILKKLCGFDNFVCIPNGVDADHFKPNSVAIERESLVWVGSLKDAYNQDAIQYFMTDIFPLIKASVPDCKVTFVGEAPVENSLRCLENSKNVMVTGYVQDVRPYVAKSSVCIVPLRCGSGTKIKVLNAMSQGKAVVTTSIGAEGIEAKRGEEIIVADEPREFATKTIYLLKHPEEAREIGLRAREVIRQKYDWKIIEKKLSHIYLNLINHRIAKYANT